MIVLSGAVAGLIAGIVATWIMDRFQYNWWDVAAWIERWRGPAPMAPQPPPAQEPPTTSQTQNYALSIHAYALAAHLVYGFALGSGYFLLTTLLHA